MGKFRLAVAAAIVALVGVTVAASAQAGNCQTDCYPKNDGSGGTRCYQHCN